MNIIAEDSNQSATKFSVSICVYKNDNPGHFKEALESVIKQTRKPDEIVLVVDGPIPESIDEVIKNYEGKSFFKVIRLPKNVGHGNARRNGLENCSNKLIALMDADDISVPDRFEKQIKCFEQNEDISIVGGNINEFIDSIDNIVGIREVPQEDGEIKEYMKKRCPFNQMTVMFKVSDVIKAGGYKDWYNNEDYYLWIRMYQNGATFKNIKDSLVLVRVGKEMYQRRGGWNYFKSEARLQKYMFKQEIITLITFANNVFIRFIVQVLMPNKIRGLIFKKFARKQFENKNIGGTQNG
jgi:glycosyltransferase involved in cell wall biosynthesis